MNRNKKNILIVAVAACFFFALPIQTLAVAGVDTVVSPKQVTGICSQDYTSNGKALTLAQCISRIYGIGISAIGIFAVLMIVVGGYFIMTAAGDTKKSSLGREYIYGAVIGVVLALGAVLILQLINPDLVNLKDPNPSILIPSNTGGGPPGGGGDPTADGQFDFQTGIEKQIGDASPQLASLLTCMANNVPGNVGQISSISDSTITNGDHTFEECDAKGKTIGCAHTAGSCHYGGKNCVGQSYAVDFGDEGNISTLTSAANTCSGGTAATFNEGNHLHVSVGNAAHCDCN